MASVPFCKSGTGEDDSGGIGSGLQQVFGDLNPKSAIDGYKFDCKDAVGYLAVYRLDTLFEVQSNSAICYNKQIPLIFGPDCILGTLKSPVKETNLTGLEQCRVY